MSSIDTSPVWEAYGRAMASVLHLELAMRVANATAKLVELEARRMSPGNRKAARNKVINSAMSGTFGPLVGNFIELHVGLLSKIEVDYFKGAVGVRNILAHEFLSGSYYGIYSESGRAEVLAMLDEWRTTFDHLERRVVEICPINEAGMREAAEQARAETGPPPLGRWV